jgi:hypothetical protein
VKVGARAGSAFWAALLGATIVVAAYDAVKAADPTVQVGLAAQSVNLNFMAQALDAGAADHFDYVTVHPYETMGLVDDGWEAQYMSMPATSAAAPGRASRSTRGSTRTPRRVSSSPLSSAATAPTTPAST